MKLKNLFSSIILSLLFIGTTIAQSSNSIPLNKEQKINWISWEAAQKANKTEPRPMVIDVYTSWCGWCKKMDKSTFLEPEVVQYVNDKMYAVKFNAEQKQDITFDNELYQNKENGKKQPTHELAYAILNNQMSYPSFVYFNSDLERITVSPGFKTKDQFLKELSFIVNKNYLNTSLESFKANK